MLTMLVVDDEIYALKGITQGIDWSDLPITAILEAESVDQAKRKLQENKVDLVISDIEMPGENGIELLRYIRETAPATLTVFLTGHARFEYAQEALQYGCFDYVLKPVDHDALKEIVKRAVDEIARRQERLAFDETLEKYRRHWNNQLPILVEKFWQEVLAGRGPAGQDRLTREFAMYDIPLSAGDRVLPVLLSIEQWDVELDARDESIMEYAVRKAAAEIILGERNGAVIQDRNDVNLVLVYLADGSVMDRNALKEGCLQYVRACNDYFHCRVSCYVGDSVRIGELAGSVERLSQLERANISNPQTVVDGLEAGEAWSGSSGVPSAPSFLEWSILLDNGSISELVGAVNETLRRYQEESVSRETLELFYYGFVHMLFQAAHRKGVSIYDALAVQEMNDGQFARTPSHMQTWAVKMVQKAGQAFQDRQRDASAVIAKIHTFIQDNIDKELGRDDIAGAVYRNPAYLSRLFRKETGLSLTDYIAQAKMERAKRLLTDTNDKVSHIAERLGYTHFSYFAKLFKKMTGVTPQDYRKKHQTLH